MATFKLILVILLSNYYPTLLARREICQHKQGLPCYSKETLQSGSSYTVTSKTCENGNYMKKEKCVWYFDVEGCTPSIQCPVLDIKGNPNQNCRGDKLSIETENGKTSLCGRKRKKETYIEEQTSNYFDIVFSTNNWSQGSGFECTVSCSGDSRSTPTPPSPLGCQCGLPNRVRRIVGGVMTEMNEYPWQVGLANLGDDLPFCGGAILSSNTIITAAHCTQGLGVNKFEVVVAEHDVTVDDGQERFRVCSKTEHPNYNSYTSDHDFSILTLCTPITFRREASPVCLPNKPGPAYDAVVSTVSGWGTLYSGGYRPDLLMEVNVTTMTNTECDKDYGGVGDITDSMICAKGNRKDACQGDSGGPLITKERGDYYSLIGVVSWGIGCADPDYPGVYARVTNDLSWIQRNIKGTTCLPPNN